MPATPSHHEFIRTLMKFKAVVTLLALRTSASATTKSTNEETLARMVYIQCVHHQCLPVCLPRCSRCFIYNLFISSSVRTCQFVYVTVSTAIVIADHSRVIRIGKHEYVEDLPVIALGRKKFLHELFIQPVSANEEK